ncbi:hypothetical protein SEA_ZIKO_84 [Gordonia phage Ziko]|uniref:Uncharacterized protein n=1 Tax=Gordonia phage Ziko TaxID=2591193 RepID=A0A514A592_9CAUD|nr:hypothetical protein SEA_ZIKO_84 [Gordonia phage Ziko]
MSDLDIWAIQPHPVGGYAATKAETIEGSPPPAGIDDPQFETISQATAYVEALGDRYIVVDTYKEDAQEALIANSALLNDIQSKMSDHQLIEVMQKAQDLSTIATAGVILSNMEDEEAKALGAKVGSFANDYADKLQEEVHSVARALGLE